MSDPIKNDVEAGLAVVRAKIAELDTTAKAEETKAAGWVAVHHVYIYVGLAFAVGALAGYFLHK